MNLIEVAWAAGLFEGEGSIMFNSTKAKGRRYSAPRLSLRTTDFDVIEKFHRLVARGTVITIANPAHVALGRKPAWEWRVGARDDVEAVLECFMPHLGERRTGKAEEALAAIAEARETKYGDAGTVD